MFKENFHKWKHLRRTRKGNLRSLRAEHLEKMFFSAEERLGLFFYHCHFFIITVLNFEGELCIT